MASVDGGGSVGGGSVDGSVCWVVSALTGSDKLPTGGLFFFVVTFLGFLAAGSFFAFLLCSERSKKNKTMRMQTRLMRRKTLSESREGRKNKRKWNLWLAVEIALVPLQMTHRKDIIHHKPSTAQ